MKKVLFFIAASALCVTAFAGGLLTNTNQNVHFLRNPARGASIEIDAVYSNPAGLAFLEHNGLTLSLNNQTAFQTRTITSTFAPFAMNGGNETKEYKGTTVAPFIPSLQAAYKMDKWVFSGNFAIVGGGGSLKFDDGLPSFEAKIAVPVAQLSSVTGISTPYSLKMNLEGTSITYGAQLGVTYKINDMFSAFVGGRASFAGNGYTGYLNNVNVAKANELTTYFTSAAGKARDVAGTLQPAIDGGYGDAPLSALLTAEQIAQMAAALGQTSESLGAMSALTVQGAFNGAAAQADGAAASVNQLTSTDIGLDTKQSGWGIAPILGVHFNDEKLNIGIKYEFKTNIVLENKTSRDDTGMFPDAAKNDYDIPALLSVGVSYRFFDDKLTASVCSNLFFDKDADMTGGRQKFLDNNSYEWMAGLEYKINPKFLVSAGGQLSRYGLTDKAQSDMNFNCNSSSVGLGGAYNITKNLTLNLAYLITIYDDYTNKNTAYTGIELYSRTNSAFGIGLDYKF